MTENKKKKSTNNLKCGIVMPIADHEDYPDGHWKEVLEIIQESVSITEFNSQLVSDDVAIGLIHDRIVTNLYNNDLIICDVSSKNPNVMFELGMRLAFDKPTIIIKDDKTGYSFDTGVIEHLSYPSSLRFSQIQEFKKHLAERIEGTYKKSIDEPNYSPFLKSFGKTIVPAKIEGQEIPESKYIIDQLENMQKEMRLIRAENKIDSIKVKNNYSLSDKKYLSKIIDDSLREILDKKGQATRTDIISLVYDNMTQNDNKLSKEELSGLVNEHLDLMFKKD